MLLVIDIGNTEVTLGLFDAEQLEHHWRLNTPTARTPDEWAVEISAQLARTNRLSTDITSAILASVAPAVTESLAQGVELVIGSRPIEVGATSDLPVVLDVEDPMQVGADRVINTLAAAHMYKRDTIVVDFGTATTFDCITGDGRFLGGVIAPGLQTAADQLTRRAAKLPATELTPPRRVIGRRTEDCIRAGVLFGAAESVDGIVRRIKAEWPSGQPQVVATGGLAAKVVELCKEIEKVEPYLTLQGLRIAAEHLGVQSTT